MSPEVTKHAAKGIIAGALLIGAVAWLFVFALSAGVRPSDAELHEIDRLVVQRIAVDYPECATERLRAPGRMQKSGDVKKGYFTYSIRCGKNARKAVAKWLVEDGRVELTSFALQ